MSFIGWAQILVVLALVLLAAMPIGELIARLIRGERNFLTPLIGPLERGFYRLAGIDTKSQHSALDYTIALLAFNLAGVLLLYAIQRLQGILPLNPQGFGPVAPDLAFNTAISFLTTSDWQNYACETTMSHFTQMAGLTVQNFLGASSGLAVAFAVSRAFAGSEMSAVGNFWTDMTRAALYLLLPLAVVVAIVMLASGIPQTLVASLQATTLEGATQAISIGPVASQEAIKLLGDNGGGFFNVNSAHPFENPSGLSNLLALGFASGSMMLQGALDSRGNQGPHGFTEILYAYASTSANNGSIFAGLGSNTPWYNTTLGIVMLIGRFKYIVPVLALAKSIAAKTKIAKSAGTFPTDGRLFMSLLLGVLVIVYLLQYFAVLALGPIVEHFLMLEGKTF